MPAIETKRLNSILRTALRFFGPWMCGFAPLVLAGCSSAPDPLPAEDLTETSDLTTPGETAAVDATADTAASVTAPSEAFRCLNLTNGAEDALILGVDADLSGGAKPGGVAIVRGVEAAVKRINDAGGLLGRPVEVFVCDHQGNPDRGLDNLKRLNEYENLLAVVGGVHTPVALYELDYLHAEEIIYLDPWAAGTPIIDNGYEPNYAFRLSVRDEYAGRFLVEECLDLGYTRVGLLLEQTGWGRSNNVAMTEELAANKLVPATVQWFHWGEPTFRSYIEQLTKADCDAILLVGNTNECSHFLNELAESDGADIPVISHWGITSGDLKSNLTPGVLGRIDLRVLQTSAAAVTGFQEAPEGLLPMCRCRSGEFDQQKCTPADAGTIHAYDIIGLLAAAVHNARTAERSIVRTELERLESVQGVLRDYAPPFTADNHEALSEADLRLYKYSESGCLELLSDKARVLPDMREAQTAAGE